MCVTRVREVLGPQRDGSEPGRGAGHRQDYQPRPHNNF